MALLVLGIAAAAQGGETRTAAQRIQDISAHDDQVMQHLDHLVNKIGPRLTGSRRIEKAYEWTRAKFESFGLHNAHTETWGEWAIGFDRKGPTTGKILTQDGEKDLTCGTWAWTAGTDGPVRARAMWEPRTREELAQVKDQLEGKWLISRGRGVGRVISREERAEVRGAVEAAGIAGRVLNVGGELILTDGSPRGITMDKLPRVPSISITQSGWQAIKTLLDQKADFELEFDAPHVFFPGPVANKNVIADIPGSEKPDEIVIVGGHIDSWDGATGTQDNGTGVATTLEAARLLMKAGIQPRRTIRFMLWSGEEQGLFGSAGYAKMHKAELDKISAVLVHDGGTNYVSGMYATPAQKKLLEPALAHLASWDPKMPFKLREVKYLPLGIGSDHDTFLSQGVPGFFWDQKGKVDYDRVHHTQHDVYEGANAEYQRHSAVTIACAALAIADLDEMLPREGMIAPRVPRKMLGVQTDPDLVIQSVVEESLAESAGLQEGDKLIALGGKKITTLQELRAAVAAAEGETEVKWIRDGEEMSATVTFPVKKADAKKPDAPKRRWL